MEVGGEEDGKEVKKGKEEMVKKRVEGHGGERKDNGKSTKENG